MPPSGLSGGTLKLILNQEMEGKVADRMYPEYRIRRGIIDLDHLELVALVKVAKDAWMPHFRRIALSRNNCVRVPQRECGKGAGRGFPNNWNPVSFLRQDGSYIPVTTALEGDYAGLLNRDLPALVRTGFTITLQLQVKRSYRPR